MRLDFWNNPIVVSAFRVRYRRGGFTSGLAPFLVALAGLGAGLEYYQSSLNYPWARIYYPILMGLQFLAGGTMAATATAASMRSEVVNRTLDFQRIAALSPRQILLGKLLGEPAIAYLMAMSTFPLAVWCFLAGAVSFEVMILMYINLATTMLLCGSAGLIGRIELPVTQGSGIFLSLFGLFTPVPLFVGIAQGNPWLVRLPLFGLDIPYLLLLPPVQLVLAYCCFRIMERQLVTPLNPMLSKPMAYALLAGIDLMTAALLFDSAPLLDVNEAGVVFCIVHFVASLFLAFSMTPWRETLYSWTWRFRRRQPLLVDLLLGDRSENILALLIFVAMGLVNLALVVVLPGIWRDPDQTAAVIPAAILSSVMILTFGTIHQWFLLIGGRLVSAFTFVLAALAVVLPLMGGLTEKTMWVVSLSPVMHFAYWLALRVPRDPRNPHASDPAFSYLVVAALYLLIFLIFWYLLRGRMRKLAAWVDFRLRLMGVLPPAVETPQPDPVRT